MSTSDQLTDLWDRCAQLLQHRVPPADFISWFSGVEPLDIVEGTLVLTAPNDFAANWIRSRFLDELRRCVAEVAGATLDVRIEAREVAPTTAPAAPLTIDEVRDELTPLPGDNVVSVATGVAAPASPGQHAQSPRARGEEAALEIGEWESADLNPRYRFDTFVIGEGNRLAHAAALSVAEAPGQSYNPLFLHGPTGLGKTHLLHAVGHYVRATRPETRVAYVTTEHFVNRFIEAIRRRDASRDRFKHYFRGVDVLLMDDVQFLSGKSQSLQEELFHTFNALHEAGKQVVLTSDREPSTIPGLEDRLVSRFSWGLIADIESPDRETRIAILRKKAKSDGIELEPGVLSLIGERITSNVRELEGALTRVVGYASLTGQPATPELAARVLDQFAAPLVQPMTIDRIQDVVCRHFGITRDDLVGKRRSNDIVLPRHIAIYLSRVLLSAPSTQVATSFGGRDHSTILHAEKRIDTMIREDREVYDLVDQLTAVLREGRTPQTPIRPSSIGLGV